MKFINYLQSIADIEIFPLLSLIIFVLFFATVSYMALREDKQSIDEQKNIPLN